MPHVTVKMYRGRSEADKQRLAEAIANATMQAIGASADSISVAIEDYDPADWAEQVFYPEIEAKKDSLYRKPNYRP